MFEFDIGLILFLLWGISTGVLWGMAANTGIIDRYVSDEDDAITDIVVSVYWS